MTNKCFSSFVRYCFLLLLTGCAPSQDGGTSGLGGTTILILIIVGIGLFLLARETTCWYWKINERTDLLDEQNDLLREIRDILSEKLPGEKKKLDITINAPPKSDSET